MKTFQKMLDLLLNILGHPCIAQFLDIIQFIILCDRYIPPIFNQINDFNDAEIFCFITLFKNLNKLNISPFLSLLTLLLSSLPPSYPPFLFSSHFFIPFSIAYFLYPLSSLLKVTYKLGLNE